MTIRKITAVTPIATLDSKLFDEWTTLEQKQKELTHKIILAYKSTPAYQARMDFARTNYAWTGEGKDNRIVVEDRMVKHSFEVFESYAFEQKNSLLHLHETTINTLLCGKVLSNSEKAKLVRVITKGMLDSEGPDLNQVEVLPE